MTEEPMMFEDDSDELMFIDEFPEGEGQKDTENKSEKELTWKVLISDDEEEIHNVTKMVLGDYLFENRKLEFLSAYSGEETKQLLLEHPDTAIILLDVVMESDNTGLDVAKWIRKEQNNSFIQIILRTGQPGKAPERKVILEYEINEYKCKTELTTQKLFTTITSALRSYRDLRTIEQSRAGLVKVIEASAELFKTQDSIKQFANGILIQFLSLLRLKNDSICLHVSGFAASQDQNEFYIIAATGQFEDSVDQPVEKAISPKLQTYLNQVLETKSSMFVEDSYIGYFEADDSNVNLLYLNGCKDLTPIDRDIIRIFSSNVAIAFDNIFLHQEIINTQKEVIYKLGEVIDLRSKEAAMHVRRVADVSYLLARKAGLPLKEASLLRYASPMHDVGKIAVPDAILNKPGKYTPEEFEKMKIHTKYGYIIFKDSKKEVLKAAAIVAQQHHERWDGKGYSEGLKGEEIHIFARITAIADVFDALSHKRVYKDAWTPEDVYNTFKEERGKHFDPHLTDIFLENYDKFLEINRQHPDDEQEALKLIFDEEV